MHFAHPRIAEIAQVADIGLTIGGQHIEAIGAGQIVAPIGGGGAQPAGAARKRVTGHHIAPGLGLIEKVHGIDAQERLGGAARSPHAEIAAVILHVQHLVDGGLDAPLQRRIARQARQIGDIVEQQKRLGAADGLFQAAEGIFVQPLEQARHIRPAMRRRDRQID